MGQERRRGHDWGAMERLHAKGKSVVVTVEGVQQSRAALETLREERVGRASALGFAATVSEPFRSGKRVRARITAHQAPFRKKRGTPCGFASFRGVDRPRPRP
jgi:hypothetical protein